MRRAIRKHLGATLALLAVAVLGLGVAFYILQQQGLRIPLLEPEPFVVKAEVIEAGGVKPGQNQAVRMAFVRIGEIKGVELEDGRALLTLAIEPRYRDRIRRDATALLRPKTGLEDMFLDIGPGTKEAPPIEEKGVIRVQNTLPDVDSEEILNDVFGERTRAYLSVLLNGGAEGLRGHGDELREVFKRLAPLHRDVARVNGALARQRRKLARLVHNYGELTTALGEQEGDLSRLVGASNSVFDALASQRQDISLTVSRLPGALRQTESTLRRVDRFADLLGPTLTELRPAFRQLDDANRSVRRLARETTPVIRRRIRPFARELAPFLDDLRPASRDLSRAMPDLTTSFQQLNRFFNLLAHNPGGRQPVGAPGRDEGYLFWLAWVAHNTNSLFSTSDASGPFRRTNFAVTCPTLRRLLAGAASESPGQGALLEVALGATSLLSDPNLCPEGGG